MCQCNHLKFLERDLGEEEVNECEKSAREYIKNDDFEIEIHNLNEVNEYFRIFKDEVLKRDKRYQTEITDLKMQINMLKAKLESGHNQTRLRLSSDECNKP